MKLLTILLILLQISTFDYGNYNNSYSNHYNSYNGVPAEQTYRGIGYTTSYSNGQFNSTQYYQSYQGVYVSVSDNSSKRPVQPRRVGGYDKNGCTIGDEYGDSSDFWNDGYDYY